MFQAHFKPLFESEYLKITFSHSFSKIIIIIIIIFPVSPYLFPTLNPNSHKKITFTRALNLFIGNLMFQRRFCVSSTIATCVADGYLWFYVP